MYDYPIPLMIKSYQAATDVSAAHALTINNDLTVQHAADDQIIIGWGSEDRKAGEQVDVGIMGAFSFIPSESIDILDYVTASDNGLIRKSRNGDRNVIGVAIGASQVSLNNQPVVLVLVQRAFLQPGPTGITGPIGPTGPSGPTGPIGPSGPTGP